MRIIVQKFGGTSVVSPESRLALAGKVKEALAAGLVPVVVVSAMGRTGDPYATDTLIKLLKSEGGVPDTRELDLAMSCGELLSVAVVTQTLRAQGIEAKGYTGGQAGILTDHVYGGARILEIRPDALRSTLDNGIVAVVAGFQGMTADGEITTLGRGASDTTAAALGVALKAEVVEIFTDVDGVMTADPRLVAKAKPLETMTYTEICEMAHLGAKVVHPRAVEIAMEGRVPLRIRSTFSPSPGTLVTDIRSIAGVEIKHDKVVTGLAYISQVALIKLVSAEDVNVTGKVVEIFNAMATAGISVDMIHVMPFNISFIVKEDKLEQAVTLLSALVTCIETQNEVAKVSVVGAGMRGVPGVMARVVASLYKAGIAILQSTDSHTNISCLVEAKDMSQAMDALHDEFGLGA